MRSTRALELALVSAAKSGNLVAARAALDGGADPNCRSLAPPRDSALHFAAAWGRLACVQLLLERGAAVDSLNDDGVTPLLCAASYQDDRQAACARLLLSHGAAIDAADPIGARPLHRAASSGNLECLRLLLERSSASAVNAFTNAYPFLNAGGDTPLHCAVAQCFPECVELLLEHGALVDAVRAGDDGWTPLHVSAHKGCTDCGQLLLAYDAATDLKSHDGHTALHRAVLEHHHNSVGLLLDHNASTDCFDAEGRAALHNAVRDNKHICTEMLLDSGASVDLTSTLGETPLYCAALCAQANDLGLDCAWLLLNRGAALDHHSSRNLASCASKRPDRELAFLLLWRGVHVPAPNLDEANEEGAAEQLLLKLTLAEWQRGGLRVWSRPVHDLLPAAVRADVASALLATLGSLDDGSDNADDSRQRYGAASDQALDSSRGGQPNPLRTLRQQHVLDNVFTVLLVAHMGRPATAPPPAIFAISQPE